MASLLNPSEEILREQIRDDIKAGRLMVNDYNDGTGASIVYGYHR